MKIDPIQAGFLAEIRERPFDLSTRLIYADWLEEHGHESRAQFLRLSCARKSTQLSAQAGKLIDAHLEEWIMAPLTKATGWPLHRTYRNGSKVALRDKKRTRVCGKFIHKELPGPPSAAWTYLHYWRGLLDRASFFNLQSVCYLAAPLLRIEPQARIQASMDGAISIVSLDDGGFFFRLPASEFILPVKRAQPHWNAYMLRLADFLFLEMVKIEGVITHVAKGYCVIRPRAGQSLRLFHSEMVELYSKSLTKALWRMIDLGDEERLRPTP